MREYALCIPVPVAELDPYGELKTGALIRLLQLAAARASEDAGFDLAWYERTGTTWVVRFTRLERLEPARHGDELLIRTWVADFRRVRSFRQYEVTRIADGATLARAATDWVYVDAASGSPAVVPPEIQSTLMPGGVATQERRKRLRPTPASEPKPLRRVELADLDSLGHVNNSQYASFVEQALIDALAARSGWQPDLRPDSPYLRTVELEIEYFEAALYRQQLSANVTPEPASDRDMNATVEILADGQRAIAAQGRWHWTDGQLPELLRRLPTPTGR